MRKLSNAISDFIETVGRICALGIYLIFFLGVIFSAIWTAKMLWQAVFG